MSGEAQPSTEPTVNRANAAAASKSPGEKLSADQVGSPEKTRRFFNRTSENTRAAVDVTPSAESKQSLYHKEITIKRKEVVHGATTGEALNIDTRFPNERKQPTVDREVTVNADTVEKYALALETIVEDYGKLAHDKSPDPQYKNKLEYVLSDPRRRSDKLLMDAIAAPPLVGREGQTISINADPAKVMEFLQTGDGWSAATMAMEKYAIWAELGRGAKAAVDVQWYRSHGGVDSSGRSNSVTLNQVPTVRSIVREGLSKGVTFAGAGLYFLSGDGRENLNLSSNIGMLTAIKEDLTVKPGDSDEVRAGKEKDKAFLSGVIEIDLDAIDIEKGKIKLNPDHPYSTQDNAAVDRRIGQFTNARNAFLEQLVIDEDTTRIGGLKIMRSRRIRSQTELETLPLDYRRQIDTELAGKTFANEYERVRNIAQAEEAILTRTLERIMEREEIKSEAGEIDAIKRKRDALVADPQNYLEQQNSEAKKKKTTAVDARKEAQKKKDALNEGDDSPSKRRAALLAKERELQAAGVSFVGDVDANARKKIEDLEEKVKSSLDELAKAQGKQKDVLVDYSDKIMDLIGKQSSAVNNLAEAIGSSGAENIGNINLSALNPDQFQQLMGAISRVSHESEITEWTDELTRVKQELNEVRLAYREYQHKQMGQEEVMLGIAARENGQLLQKTGKAYTDLIAEGTSEDDIRTLSADDLAKKIYTGSDDKEKAKALQTAFDAKAESAALQDEMAAPLPQRQVDALAVVTDLTTGISEDELLTRRITELAERMRAADMGLSDDDINTNIQDAIFAAGRKLMTRYTIRVDKEIEYYDSFIKAQDKILTEIADPKKKVAELDVALAVLQHSGEIYSRLNGLLDPLNQSERDAFVDSSPIASTDLTYSQAERDKGAPKGYVETFHRLYPEAEQASNRNELFEAFYRHLPPDKFAQIFAQFAVGLKDVSDVTYAEAAEEMQEGWDDITQADMQKFVRGINTHIKKSALAL